MKASSVRFLVLVALWLGFSTAAMASLSWYDAAGALAAGVGTPSATHEEAERFRETMRAVVAEYDKIGAGELAQQCIDASRIVQIAENPSGWREILFLLAGLVSLIAALFITKILASMFKVEIAQLLWIPIAGYIALLVGLFVAIRAAKKRKVAVAAGVALSAAGVISFVDPVRHAFFGIVADVFVVFTAWYVPIAAAALGIAGLLIVFFFLCKNVGDGFGAIGAFLLRNTIGLVAIPGVCAFLFLVILSVVGPWFEDHAGELAATREGEEHVSQAGVADGSVPFAAYSEDVRRAAAEMARVAEDVYEGTLPQGAKPFDGFLSTWRTQPGVSPHEGEPGTGTFSTQSGLVAQVFQHRVGWHGGEIVVVFRGTASVKDGMEDWRQLLGDGYAPQYAEAAALVRAVRASTELPLVVLGHSLGGGQTQYAVAMNQGSDDIRGVGFNPAGLSANSVRDIEMRRGEGDSVRAAHSLAMVRLDNDPVSTAGVLLGRVVGVPSGGIRGFASHSISTLTEAMERQGN